MRLILIFIISTITLSANGQVNTLKPIFERKGGIITSNPIIDTIPLVKYVNTENKALQPAIYINGEFSNAIRIKTVDPMLIDSIHVEKKEIEIENKRYYGQIFFKMKKEYSPQLISLTNLAMKYTNLKNGLTIFMLDNDIIQEDYDQCLVDEKYILQIIVNTVEMGKEKTIINVVRLMTKSKENIEKSREIRIRGLDEMTLYRDIVTIKD